MRHKNRARAYMDARRDGGRLGIGRSLAGLIVLCSCTAQITDSGDATALGGASSIQTGGGPAGAGFAGALAGGGAANGSDSSGQNGLGGTQFPVSGNGGAAVSTGGDNAAPPLDCVSPKPGRSPLRRLTTREYNNTVRDLLGDTTKPGDLLPAQVDSKDNWFGNDADFQSVPDTLIEKYQAISEDIAARATGSTSALARLHACAGKAFVPNSPSTSNEEEACARAIAESITPRAYRRAATRLEIDELVALYRSVRALSSTSTFGSGVAAMLEGILQSPDFLYRLEFGTPVAGGTPLRRIAGREMATRLSYLLWQTMPDAALFEAADSGRLDSTEGVVDQARKMLEDSRSHATVAFFFDNFLPIPDLTGLAREASQFPNWSSSVGAAMRGEVQRVIEHEIFENNEATGQHAPGSWPALLTTPYTFANDALFRFYGASTFAPGSVVTGSDFKKVKLNSDQRLGLLTLGGVMAGSTTSNRTNPVLRGIFIVNKVMCSNLELPTGLAPPQIDPYSGKTARERVKKHSQDSFCAGCHRVIDGLGLPFENYDAIGAYRASEKWTDPTSNVTYDTPIDASGAVPGVDGVAANAVELSRQLATSETVQNCFASHWMQFAYGRSLDSSDTCNTWSVRKAFKASGYNVKQLLLSLTQTDAFLYRAAD
ncbi:MAG TPA: DUF1592 domain-containing protein [Polyangiaceae bacterium]|nr:DUF1592 domain-containing protein [Polyangiaceae bacterium]